MDVSGSESFGVRLRQAVLVARCSGQAAAQREAENPRALKRKNCRDFAIRQPQRSSRPSLSQYPGLLWRVTPITPAGTCCGDRGGKPCNGAQLGPQPGRQSCGCRCPKTVPRSTPSKRLPHYDHPDLRCSAAQRRRRQRPPCLGADQHLTALHDGIQEAFGWQDDHLYSFWLDNTFWGDDESEITSPVDPGEGTRTADLPITELDLHPGQRIAYVFDFGDDWRVRLTMRGEESSDGGRYPRVLQRTGHTPPQYPDSDDEA